MTSPNETTAEVLVVEDDEVLRRTYEDLIPIYTNLTCEGIDQTGKRVEQIIASIRKHPALALILDGQYQDGTALDILNSIANESARRIFVISGDQDIILSIQRAYPPKTYPLITAVLKGSSANIETISEEILNFVTRQRQNATARLAS
ncbi:hypothetical protein IPG41_03645 [Candidatus Peregrinibacteria bacterium]|nr:MAG: hypothetical protein IPG41_03645 [Candidatus Peregrinibacteria bacterium]